MITELVIFGSGGHANSCIEIINQYSTYSIIGYVDKKENTIFSEKHLGNDEVIKDFYSKSKLVIGFGSLSQIQNRIRIFNNFSNNFNFINLISKFSYISGTTKLGRGVQIFNHVMINRNVSIGNNCIINSKSLIEHDVCIEDNSVISTGVIINGHCSIGENTFIGSGTIVFDNVNIGRNSIIGSGLTIRKNIPDNSKIIKNL